MSSVRGFMPGMRASTPVGARFTGAKIYPTGEGVMYPVHRQKPKGNSPLDSIKELWKHEKEHFQETARLFGLRAGYDQLLLQSATDPNLQAGRMQGAPPLIESTDPTISHTPRGRKGVNGLGSHGARVLRYSAGAIERNAGSPSRLSFLTLTLPPMSEGAWVRVLEGWGDIVRTVVQWLKRRLEAKGLPGLIAGCIELQTSRASRSGEPALHIHVVFQGRRKGQAWAVTPRQCRDAWRRAVSTFAQENLEFANSENLCQVRKSAARYLAKYMSKGGAQWKSLVSPVYQNLHPSAWSITPDSLKRKYHECTWTGDEALSVVSLAIENPAYRFGETLNVPIYQLPNGQWVKVVLVRLERAFATSLDPRWIP